MRILVTNDDGIYAPGIIALRDAAEALGEVHVVAPVVEQSGVAHGISLMEPLRVFEAERDGKFFGHAVNGAPADCVRLAVRELLRHPPDLILSGVNLGLNIGCDVFYSGTVAAAMEGALLGIPSLAVSMEHSRRPKFEFTAKTAIDVAKKLILSRKSPREPILLSMNVPLLPKSKLKGIRVTRQSRHGGEEGFVKRKDPRGRYYYWFSRMQSSRRYEEGTDIHALRAGYVSVTPLIYNLTENHLLEELEKLI